MTRSSLQQKQKAKFIACDFLVKRVVTFGAELYRFADLHIGSFIRYKQILDKNYFPKCNKLKRILISFNCFA